MAIIEPTILLRSSEFAWLYESHPGFKILDDDLFDHDLLEVIGVQQGSPTHEQLLAWPVIASLCQHPGVVVAVANDHWVAGTSVPTYQRLATGAWSRLFGIPSVSATNL